MISEVQVDDERVARELLKVLYVPLLCTLCTLFVLYVRPVLYVPILTRFLTYNSIMNVWLENYLRYVPPCRTLYLVL